MEQEEAMLNRQKMENLLREISYYAHRQNLWDLPNCPYRQNPWDLPNQDRSTNDGLPFTGKLGDKVAFSGGFYRNKGHEEDSRAAIDLRCQDQQLARIEMEHGFIASSAVYFLTDETNIKVISPKWKADYGVCDTTYDQDQKKQLSVLHSPNETAAGVMAKIFDVIARSKDHKVIAEKLRQLNLPSKITIKNANALADSIVDQIRDTATKDNGREM